jgi:gliding motility-associated-like protein
MNLLYTYYQKKSIYRFFLHLTLIAFILSPALVRSQMVGTSCYTTGTYVQYGIDGTGGYEGVNTVSCPPPAGFHPRSNNSLFGFVSNPQANGWATFDGDFFTPGSPENGWGIEIINGATDLTASNNAAGPVNIPGSITGYLVNGLCRVITWEGNYISGSYNIHVKIEYVLMTGDLFYTTVCTFTNNGISIPDFYYYRNLDPDNNVSLTGYSDFTTTNTIVSQPGTGCDKAHVRATSINPGSQPSSYLGLAGVGTNWRCIHGGFFNRDATDIWNGVAGLNGTSGSSAFADEAIALAYRMPAFNAGTTQQCRFVVILDDLAANNAVNNLFSVTWPGAPPSLSTVCNPITDTVTICNGGSTNLSVTGSALASFNWSWSPTTGLSPTTGATVTASPTTNTLYTITGTPTNPCFNPVTQQIYVKVVPGTTNANAGPNKVVSCTALTAILAGSTTTPGATYSWAGPGVVSGGTTLAPTVNAPGLYTLTVTAGGCSASDTMTVFANNIPPNANAGVPMSITCTTPTTNLAGSSSTAGATCSWTGPGITAGGSTWTPTVNAVGNYTITVTNPSNGCTATSSVAVTLNNTPPNVNAGPPQNLTCSITSVNLAGSSSTVGATCTWAGPGIVSGGTTWTPTVNLAGTYTITITNPSNGCTASGTTSVTGSTGVPNANAGIDMVLTCTNTSLNLGGSSTTAGATFAWSGPSITAGGTTATPTVNGIGNYTVTVTNPSNGCTATDVAVVTLNNTPPNANAGADMILTCTITSLNLAGSSSTGGATFAWAGPSITAGAGTATPTVNGAGLYTITVTNPANGCTATDQANVTLNNTPPNANAGPDAVLNCTTTSINLSGSSSTAGVSFAWAGPSITAGGTTTTPTVNGAGLYTITVTNPVNGCTATDQANVTLNNTPPNANAGPDQILNCTIPTVNMAGSSTTAGVSFAWSGPGIISGGTTATPTVNTAGLYIITVTNPVNGCTATDQANVTMNGTPPNSNAGSDQILNCTVTSLNMSGSSSTAGATYAWAGPAITGGGTTSTPSINGPGSYTVTVTDPSNGCTSTDVADVTQNITPPGANAGLDDVLNCNVSNVNLNASSTAPGATFNWTGPNIVYGGSSNAPNVNGPGAYTVTTTDPVNGCTSTDVVDIVLNNTPPNISMGPNQNILCNTPVVNLAGGSSTAGVSFSWAGTGMVGATTNTNLSANAQGTYTCTVTDPSNGCTSTGTVDAILDLNFPTAGFGANNQASCAPLCATLSDQSIINGTAINQWRWDVESQGIATTPGGTFCFTNPGTYDVTLTVTTIDGCTSTLTIPNYLTVYPQPDADFMYTPQEITEFDPLLKFGNTTYGADTYTWDFGDGSTSTVTDPNHLYADTGTYCVTLFATTAFGCSDTATHCLYVAPEYALYIPNTFTANEDGINEIWSVIGRGVKTFEAKIFNRWGEEIYAFDNIAKGWNGTQHNGGQVEQGVYVYRVAITDFKGDAHEYYGNLNLIR